jgi:hypothetical protein
MATSTMRSSLAYCWGSTAAEREAPYPCDEILDRPDRALFRAVDVDAPPPLLFRWLCQLRAAPYSYDLIDNLGRISPRTLTPGLDRLEVGQGFMSIFRLADFDRGSQITLRMTKPRAVRMFGEICVSYMVRPRGLESRLLVKLLVRDPGHAPWSLLAPLLPWGDLVMMHKQLLTLKKLAERDAADGSRRS